MTLKSKFSLLILNLAVIFTSSLASADGAGLSSCKAIVGSATTAGTGGLSNGSGSIKATSTGLNILVCDANYTVLPATSGRFPRPARAILTAYVENVSPTNNAVCSFTRYLSDGRVAQSQTRTLGSGVSTLSFDFTLPRNTSDYLGFSCRLGPGDKIHGFS